MPVLAASRRHPATERARRRTFVQAALARIPAEARSGTDPEAIRVRAAAFGIEPGQGYQRRARSAETASGAFGSQPYVGEMMFFGGSYAPNAWLPCDGRLLTIAEYDVLFVLLGTTYGGDGQNTFGLPDLQGRVPLGTGQGPGLSNRSLGEMGGTETVTLTTNQLPSHTHLVSYASGAGTQASPVGAFPASVPAGGKARYGATGAGLMTSPSAVGSSQPHGNLPPYLALTVCISVEGIFPSPS